MWPCPWLAECVKHLSMQYPESAEKGLIDKPKQPQAEITIGQKVSQLL